MCLTDKWCARSGRPHSVHLPRKAALLPERGAGYPVHITISGNDKSCESQSTQLSLHSPSPGHVTWRLYSKNAWGDEDIAEKHMLENDLLLDE